MARELLTWRLVRRLVGGVRWLRWLGRRVLQLGSTPLGQYPSALEPFPPVDGAALASPTPAIHTSGALGVSSVHERQVRKGFERLYASELQLLVATRRVEAQLRGADCRELSAIFEEQSVELGEVVSLVAERLSGAPGRVRILLPMSSARVHAPTSMTRFDQAIVERHTRLMGELRQLATLFAAWGEVDHLGFVRSLQGEHEQMVWGLSHPLRFATPVEVRP